MKYLMHMIFSFMVSSILFNNIQVILIFIVHVLIIHREERKGGGGLMKTMSFSPDIVLLHLPLNTTYEILVECSIDTS